MGGALFQTGLATAVGYLYGAKPQAILMAIAFAASGSFLTPLGTPPNMLVWKAGNYKFADYLKVGAGLSFVYLLVGVIIIPLKCQVFP